MTLDRWRGTPGVIGWLVMKWDVWHVKRFVKKLKRSGPGPFKLEKR